MEYVLCFDGSLKELAVRVPTALAELLCCKLLQTLAAGIKHLYSYHVMDLANGEPCHNSVFWRTIE
jgi:hypothetical protein